MIKIPPHRVEASIQIKEAERSASAELMNAQLILDKADYGNGIVGAVLDTGVDITHPDLQGVVIGGRNFCIDLEGLLNPDDVHDRNGHGTHCSGIACAVKNGIGILGVAPQARIFMGKVMGDNGTGDESWLANAIRYCISWVGPNGERIRAISMSLGGASTPALETAVKEADAAGIVLVAAAGNEGDGNPNTIEISYPAGYPEVISVGAVNSDRQVVSFSNANPEVDIVTLGANVLSCVPGGKYEAWSGTSMATPAIFGLVLLIIKMLDKKLGRKATPTEVKAELYKRCVALLDTPEVEQGHGLPDMSIAQDDWTIQSAPGQISKNIFSNLLFIILNFFKVIFNLK